MKSLGPGNVLTLAILVPASVACRAAPLPVPPPRVTEALEIDRVPSWFPVGFCLLTGGATQYVGYYDEEHRMTVARRRIGESRWQRVHLPGKIGWDSHNYVTMALDSDGNIHLAGNMHCVPLVYFRTRKPGDISSFERQPMTGQEEDRCTYPRFMQAPDGKLLFMYRSGGSGNGRRHFNVYDTGTRTWRRFLDTPLFDGQGQCNAYPLGPSRGPDGLFHLVWVWRDTPDCATNHDLSYARSRDLRHWETAGGESVSLPFTLDQTGPCVDPVPRGGGIINGCERLAFDSSRRPIIAYHREDEDGRMQVYVARFEDGDWRRRPVTAWKEEIDFGGRGAMPFIGIKLGELRVHEGGLLSLGYRHRDHGSGRIVLDEETLEPVERDVVIRPDLPADLGRPTIDFHGMRVRTAGDSGRANDSDVRYVLRWEALGANHDRPREPPLPPASTLMLLRLDP